jgi:hypothetical protein
LQDKNLQRFFYFEQGKCKFKHPNQQMMIQYYRAFLASLMFFVTVVSLSAQIADDFSDPDLGSNPTWQGNIDHFNVNVSEELQLTADEAGESWLYTETSFFDSTVWDIYCRLEFAPSGSNQQVLFLQLDNADPSIANGYGIKVGESGSEDKLEFFRLDGGTETILVAGSTGAMGSDPAVCRIQIRRDADGNWIFLTDYSGGANLENEFTISDNNHAFTSGFFGLFCTYTDSRKDKFFFDDIAVQPILPDTEAPILLEAEALDENTIQVSFSEPLEETSANQATNYTLSNGVGNPATANLDPVNPTLVILDLSSNLESPQTYTLEVSNVKDQAGNTAGRQTVTFDYINIESAAPYDIIINEILADPSPAQGLPETEFVEIFNVSQKIFNLEDYQFQDETGSPILLPPMLLYPGEYLILCDEEVQAEFSPFGKVAPIDGFPSLTNGGEQIRLSNLFGDFIDEVQYSDDWYLDANKAEGGWSLERVNPNLFCLEGTNWVASENLAGGTPGRENSVYNPQSETPGPSVLSVYPISTNEIRIRFDQGMDLADADDLRWYTLDGGPTITTVDLSSENKNEILLQLDSDLQAGIVYTLLIDPLLRNCTGIPISGKTSFRLGLPETAAAGDILINEILSNPATGGNDFIELQNVSSKIIDLSTLSLGNIQPGDTDIEAIDQQFLMLPGDLIVLSSSRSNILDNYSVPAPENLLENSLPSFPDDIGNVTLGIQDLFGLQVIDEVDYSDEWHHPLLDDQNGVSLERISSSQSSQDPANWQSASSTAGFATPTGVNSQNQPDQESTENDFILQPRTFSPDQDGRDDFLSIIYNLNRDGFLCTLTIFDVQGNEINQLLRNELLAREGIIKWEGLTENGERAPIGIYILHIELSHPDGETRQLQKTAVIATQLD